jgi:hypothetical protein
VIRVYHSHRNMPKNRASRSPVLYYKVRLTLLLAEPSLPAHALLRATKVSVSLHRSTTPPPFCHGCSDAGHEEVMVGAHVKRDCCLCPISLCGASATYRTSTTPYHMSAPDLLPMTASTEAGLPQNAWSRRCLVPFLSREQW